MLRAENDEIMVESKKNIKRISQNLVDAKQFKQETVDFSKGTNFECVKKVETAVIRPDGPENDSSEGGPSGPTIVDFPDIEEAKIPVEVKAGDGKLVREFERMNQEF